MTDRGIIFSPPMVRELLREAGDPGTGKTQTRRIAKITAIMGNRVPVYPPEELIELEDGEFRRGIMHYLSTGALSGPYKVGYAVGDHLYVREKFCVEARYAHLKPGQAAELGARCAYLSDGAAPGEANGWGRACYPRSMPRKFSRLTLIVTDVRVQPLQEISEADAIAEGIYEHETELGRLYSYVRAGDSAGAKSTISRPAGWEKATQAYVHLWDRLHNLAGERWDDNPWVVCVTFTVKRGNIDD